MTERPIKSDLARVDRLTDATIDYSDVPALDEAFLTRAGFEGPTVTFADDRFDYGEERFITLGLLAGRVVVVAHTLRGEDATRIISMRKANRREQEVYQERLGEG